MRRMIGAACAAVLAVGVTQAHFVYVVPDAADATRITVVFSDSLEPDESLKKESFDKVAGAKLTARGADGKDTAVAHTRDGNSLKATVPSGTKVVFGTADFGVYQKGDAKPVFLRYYPKAIVGPIAADGGAVNAALEVVPAVESGKVRFRVLAAGKPVAGSEVTILTPSGEKAKATTDDNGYTPAQTGSGRYGVFARKTEDTAGEVGGKKYEQIGHYATLVADVK